MFNHLHVHTMLSLLDSCTSYKDYVDKAKEYGQAAIAFTEHANLYNHLSKKLYCDKLGIKFIFGVEVYLTRQLEPKVRDNYHTILLAKNQEGVKEINLLVGLSTRDDHVYYKPRITFDEFLNISDNVITLSACLQSPLNRLDENDEYYVKLLNRYDFLEVQPHEMSKEQMDFNKKLARFCKDYKKKLVATTDVHSLNDYKAKCRKVLLKAKDIHFKGDDTNGLEEKFNLTFKSEEEMRDEFMRQGVLTPEEIEEAIHNTVVIADMCEDLVVDKSFKYPKISDNDEELFKKAINEGYLKKKKAGYIEGGKKYLDQIQEEFRVFKKLNMMTFMLSMSRIVNWCKDNGIPMGPSRGSVAGSLVAYLLNITEVDPIRWNTIFSRFANENRLELGDIDVDAPTDSRDRIYQHIFEEFGQDKCAYVLALGTISEKATIDEIGRAFNIPLDEVSEIKQQYDIDPQKTKEKYPKIFYYFDGLVGTTVSQSIHPAGVVISPITLPDNYGVFYKDGMQIINLDMEDVHDSGLVKYDILALRNVDIIRDTCKQAGLPYPTVDTMDFEDKAVWEDMTKSRVGIFEFEKPYAMDLLKKYNPSKISDVSMINAALRPSGASYRDRLVNHEVNKNPSKEIDDLLSDTSGFLLYQEQIIAFLQNLCGYSGSEADTCRRMIARKHPEELEAELPKILDGYCNHSTKPREEAEKEAQTFVQIVSDASSYMFGKNHSDGYSIVAYYCAYYRYHYPGQFITAYLNTANGQEDIQDGTELARQKNIKITAPKFRKSIDKYIYDSDANQIHKGIGSIKYISADCSDQLYAMRFMDFPTFTDLLVYLRENTSVDARQIKVLTTIGFFSEFGKNKKLLSIVDKFFERYKKTYVAKTKEARVAELKAFEASTPDEYLPLAERIQADVDYVGYVSFTQPELPKPFVYVLAADAKFTPRVTLYCIATGKSIECKVDKKFYGKHKFKADDILYCKKFQKRPNWKKTENGFEQTGTYCDCLVEYDVVTSKFA